MINFYEVVKIENNSCKKCFSFIYTLPCKIDKSFCDSMGYFGKNKYPIELVKLIHIVSNNNFEIITKLDQMSIKFIIPKELEDQNYIAEKEKFDTLLATWLTEKLDIKIGLQ